MAEVYQDNNEKSIGKPPQKNDTVFGELAEVLRLSLLVPVDSNVVVIPHELIVRYLEYYDWRYGNDSNRD